jgi:hypothetical protein
MFRVDSEGGTRPDDAGSVLGTGVGGWLCREKSVTE